MTMSLTDEDKRWISDLLDRKMENVVNLIAESTERLSVRLDDVVLRLDRQASYWQTGRRWSARQEEWSERVDKALEVKDRQIADLADRMRRLEERK